MRNRSTGWSRARAVVMAVSVAACGVAASAVAGAELRRTQLRQAEERMDRSSTAVQVAVADQMSRYLDAVQGTAAALSTHAELDTAAFDRVTLPLATQRLAGAKAVTFLTPASAGSIDDTARLWQERGATGLDLRQAPQRRDHLFTIFSRGLGDNLAVPSGTDGSAAPAATAVARRTRDTGQVAISDAYVLLSDGSLPPALRQLSFLVAAPVYRTPDNALVGYLFMSIRGTDFMASTLQRAAGGLLDADLLTRSEDGRLVTVAAVDHPDSGRADRVRDMTVNAGQRTWTIRTKADYRNLLPANARADLAVAGAGSLLALVFGALFYLQATARRRAEAAVRAATAEARIAEDSARTQAELLASVVNSISDGVCVVDGNGAFLVLNPAAAELLGTELPVNGPPGWTDHFGAFRPDGMIPFPAEELPLARALAGEPRDNVPMLIRNEHRPDGAMIMVSARPLDDPSDRRGAVAVFHDITDRTRADVELAGAATRLQRELAQRRAAEAELRAARDAIAEQKAYLNQVLDALQIAVVTCDTDGHIVHANRMARAGLPASPRPLHMAEVARGVDLRRSDGSVPADEDLPLARALRGERVDGDEYTAARGDRRSVVRAQAVPLRHEAGHLVGAVISTYDVTALREREADLTAFAGVVAHDLNSPLASIGGYAELLDEEFGTVLVGPDGDNARRHLQRVRSTVERMRQLIEDLLAYTAAGDAKLNLSTTDLRAVVDDVVTTRLEALVADPGSDVAPPDVYVGALPSIFADPSMLRQLIDNLIGNALKYTPPGRPARIDVTAAPDAKRGFVRVEIADRGIGIPEGQHHAIFTGFHRAHHGAGYAGTGLGLAICQRVVERHGGTIGVADNPGGGARFFATLPAGDPAPGDDALVNPAPQLPEAIVAQGW